MHGAYFACILIGIIVIALILENHYKNKSENSNAVHSISSNETPPRVSVCNMHEPAPEDYIPKKPMGKTTCVFIDVETTGLNPHQDSIVQVTALRYIDDKAVDGINTYINPGRPIPARATQLHGITDEMVQDAPTISDIKEKFLSFIDGAVLIGYNTVFDLNFLSAAFGKALDGAKYIDVLPAARNCLSLPNYRLETVATHLGFKPEEGFHDSLTDCFATAAIFSSLGLSSLLDSTNTYQTKDTSPTTKKIPIRPKETDEEIQQRNYAAELAKKGESFEKTGDIEKAINAYEESIAAGCGGTLPYRRLVIIYRRRHRYDDEIRISLAAINAMQSRSRPEDPLHDTYKKEVAYYQKRIDTAQDRKTLALKK